MTWAWPEAAWFVLLLPLVPLLWQWREGRRPTLRHPDMRYLPVTESRRARWARWLPLLGRLLAALLVLVALIGPRWPVPGSRIPSDGIALVFVLDVSGSMGESDVLLEGQPVTRLQAAAGLLKQFIAGGNGYTDRNNDAIGLVTFAAKPVDVCPPTLSHQAILHFLDKAKPIGTVPDSSTNIGDALGLATNLLRNSPIKSKAIILISDGEHTVPADVDAQALKPRQAAQLAAALGIRVHTIFLSGSPNNDAARQAEMLRAEQTLRAVSQMTQGESSSASDGAGLMKISQRLDTLEKSRLESFVYTDYVETRPWLIVCALVCMLVTIVLEETWLRLHP